MGISEYLWGLLQDALAVLDFDANAYGVPATNERELVPFSLFNGNGSEMIRSVLHVVLMEKNRDAMIKHYPLMPQRDITPALSHFDNCDIAYIKVSIPGYPEEMMTPCLVTPYGMIILGLPSPLCHNLYSDGIHLAKQAPEGDNVVSVDFTGKNKK